MKIVIECNSTVKINAFSLSSGTDVDFVSRDPLHFVAMIINWTQAFASFNSRSHIPPSNYVFSTLKPFTRNKRVVSLKVPAIALIPFATVTKVNK